MKRSIFFAVMLALAIGCGVAAAQTSAPATTQSVEKHISPEAAVELDKVKAAYTDLKSLALTGKMAADFDVDGQQVKENADFTSTYSAPNQFRHVTKDEVEFGSTGEKTYVLANQRNIYRTQDAPSAKQRFTTGSLPEEIMQLLFSKDPSLMLAVAPDGLDEVTNTYPNVKRLKDEKLDGADYVAIGLSKGDANQVTLLIDPKTHLVRRIVTDLSSRLRSRGAGDVKKALLTVDYPSVSPGQAIEAQTFAWAPPANAKEATEGGEEDLPGYKLAGKPAADFTLKDINDKEVKLADLKGSVVVLDFWATWCPPCIESLPHIDRLYRERSGEGVKVFAVNDAETKEQVKEFVAAHDFKMPFLLDPDGETTKAYLAPPIPLTVVIGKDGVVSKVVYFSSRSDQQLNDAISAALKAPK